MQLLERLVVLLQQPAGALPRSLVENAAITLGRLAWMCTDALAPHVGAFLGPWYDAGRTAHVPEHGVCALPCCVRLACRCTALRGIRDDVEKEHAFLGLCALLQLNPQVSLRLLCILRAGAAGWRCCNHQPCLCPQGAGQGGFVQLCEAIVSWRHIACEGLRNSLVQLMQASALASHAGSSVQQRGAGGACVSTSLAALPAHHAPCCSAAL